MSATKLRVVWHDPESGNSASTGEVALRTFFETVYAPRRLTGHSARTAEAYQSTLSRFDQHLGRDAVVKDINDTALAHFSGWMLSTHHVSNATVNKHVLALKAIARQAHRDGLLDVLPTFGLLPKHKRQNRCWTREEVGALIAACRRLKPPSTPAWHYSKKINAPRSVPEDLQFEAIVRVMYETGVRLTALMCACRQQLDVGTGILRIRAEHQKDREDLVRQLSSPCLAVFRSIDDARSDVDTRLIPWIWDARGHPWTTLRRRFRGVVKEAGLPCTGKDQFHKLRRTYATYTAIDVGLPRASELLGHSHLSVTRGYVDWQLYDSLRQPAAMPDPILPTEPQRMLFE